MSTNDIENSLKNAPAPAPPPDLKQQLVAAVKLPPPGSNPGLSQSHSGGWLSRWWPALLPAALALGAGTVLMLQNIKIDSIEQTIAALSHGAVTTEDTAASPATKTSALLPGADYEQEAARLKGSVAEVKAQIAQLEQLRAENDKLRPQLATAAPDVLAPEEKEAMDKARDTALSVACVNNLKQFGLAVRVFEQDSTNMTPPAVLSMSNELSSTKILICPADKGRQAAASWGTFSTANCSYEYLVPFELEPEKEPNRVLARCPIHGHICLCDGSVQGNIGKNHPDWLVEHNGKLYFEPRNDPPQPAGAPPR